MGDEPDAMSDISAEQRVFAEALLQNTPETRANYLDQACHGNPALRLRVEKLLRAAANAGDFLKHPRNGFQINAPPRSRESECGEKAGDRIGRYRLLDKIGEGGCGTVYLTEQEHPVRRQVALKILKPGLDTGCVVARFEAERQALALMEHPNIARVLDGGATQAGRPYFVMELVRGTRITEFCAGARLEIEARLRLFVQVCHAVQHAHQKGIIHRDLKPSNILVTVNDGVAVPKIIDFGIAKASGQRLTDKTIFTQFHAFIGTPAYTSPEQAEMSSVDVDTRSDIYSLGVLLYELLTGRTPFDGGELLRSGLDEMRRVICEKEPIRPSVRVIKLSQDEREVVAAQFQSEHAMLAHRLRGDLDCIVMRCLEKDRVRRYGTANSLADDVLRHLENEPVTARPAGKLYRFRKSVRRNRLAYTAGGAVAGALFVGLSLACWALIRERSARNDAEAARISAHAESARNEAIARFFMTSTGPGMWRGHDAALVRKILDGMSEGVGRQLADHPDAQGDLWVSLGNTYAAIEDYDRAIASLKHATGAYRSAFGNSHSRLARALALLGKFQNLNNEFPSATTNAHIAIAIARNCNDPETLATCLLDGAKAVSRDDKPATEAIPLLRETMRLRRYVVPHMLALLDSTRLLTRALEGLASEGRQTEAEAILREELKEAPADADLLRLLNSLTNAPPKIEKVNVG